MESIKRPEPTETKATLPRREFINRTAIGFASLGFISGCVTQSLESSDSRSANRVDLVIGQRGLADGRFQKPRALAISPSDHLCEIENAARVPAFEPNAKFLCGLKTPKVAQGTTTGAT